MVTLLRVLVPVEVSAPPDAVASTPPLTVLPLSWTVDPAPVARMLPDPVCVTALLLIRSVPPVVACRRPALLRPVPLVCRIRALDWSAVIVPAAWLVMPIVPWPILPEPRMALSVLTRTPSLKPEPSRTRLLVLLLSATVPPPVSVTVLRLIRMSLVEPMVPSRAMVPLLVMAPTKLVTEPTLTW